MKNLWKFCCLLIWLQAFGLLADGPVVQTTPLTRNLLRAPDVGTARSVLGIIVTNVGSLTNQLLVTPTVTGGATIDTLNGASTNQIGTISSNAANNILTGSGTNTVNTLSSNTAFNVSLGLTPTNKLSLMWYVSPTNSATYVGTGTILGNGTLTQPFYGDFDAIVLSQPPFSQGNLLPTGTNNPFWTLGNNGYSSNLVLKAGMTLSGYNGAQVIIKRTTTYSSGQEQVLYGSGDYITVRNITTDGSGTNGQTAPIINGIVLSGNYEKAEHCTSINWLGNFGGGQECWGFYLGHQLGTLGCEISDCTVSNAWGNYDDAFEADGDGYVHDNRAIYPYASTNNDPRAGINYAWGVNGRYVNNYIWGGLYGAYADTGAITNVSFLGNYFVNVPIGIDAHIGPSYGGVSGYKAQGNTILFNTNVFAGVIGECGPFVFDSRETTLAWKNILIAGNHIGFYCPGEPVGTLNPFNQCAFFFYNENALTGAFQGVQILGNFVDNNFPSAFNGAQMAGLNISLNYDQNGAGYSNVLDPSVLTAFQQQSQNLGVPAYPQNPLNAGLLLDMSFIEGTGTNIYNYATSYAITNQNFTPVCSMVGGAYLWSTGQVAYALSMTNFVLSQQSGAFNNFTNCLKYAVPNAAQAISNMTIQIVVKQPAFVGGNYDIPLSLQQLGSSNCFQLWFTATQTGVTLVGGNTNEFFDIGTSYADGNWHQIAASYNGTAVTLYVDGAAVGSQAAQGVVFPAVNGAISAYIAASRLGGYCQEAKVWTRALGPNDIKLAYRQIFSP